MDLLSDENLIHHGSGPKNCAFLDLGGTIVGQSINGEVRPCPDVCRLSLREAIARLSKKAAQKLGELVLYIAPNIEERDSGNATMDTHRQSVRAVQTLIDTGRFQAIVVRHGTETFHRLCAALFQGIRKGTNVPIVATNSMRHFEYTIPSDALRSTRNAIELVLDDSMIDETDGVQRGKAMAVVNAGDYAYPLGTLHKQMYTFQPFVSRANRLTDRTSRFGALAENAYVIQSAKKKVFEEERMWHQEDHWESDPVTRPPRPSDFPQYEGSMPFPLTNGIKTIELSSGYMYEDLFDELRGVQRQSAQSLDKRTRKALIWEAPGIGLLRSDVLSQWIVRQVAGQCADEGVPCCVGSETWSKQRLPQTEKPRPTHLYPGDIRLFDAKIVPICGLMDAEREVLISRLVAEAHQLGKQKIDVFHYVREGAKKYMSQWS